MVWRWLHLTSFDISYSLGIQDMMKTFVLGLGAQKAGTTWFYQYLKSSPKSAMGALKEYHVWDAIHVKGCRHFLQTDVTQELPRKKQIRRQLQESETAYFDYFEKLLTKRGKELTADISPSYSGLSRDVLARIRQGFEKKGIDCKAVFFMRDPVERCWSFIRMLKSRKDHRIDEATNLEELALSYAQTTAASLRARYEQILPEIDAVFSPDKIYIGFYETMFDVRSICNLSEFLGIDANPEFVEAKFNVSSDTAILSEKAKAQIANCFQATYRYAAIRYPETTTIWANSKYAKLEDG